MTSSSPLLTAIVLIDPWKLLTVLIIILVTICWYQIKPLPIPLSVPGPKRYPFIGFLWHPNKYWHVWPTESTRLSKLYKQTWGGPLPNFGGLPGAFFYVHDEANIKHILHANFDNYVKGDRWTRILGELLGTGIFAVDGDRWKIHRKLMSNMFSRNLLRHTAVITKNKLLELLGVFGRRISEADFPTNGINIDLQDFFFRLTIDTTSIVNFGMDLHSVGNEQQHKFALAFDELTYLVQMRLIDPLFEVKRALRLTWAERRIRVLKDIVDEFCYQVIADKRRSANEGSPLGPDLLSRFIHHAQKTNEGIISDSELRDVVMNVMLAGRDTTACAMSWTFYELMRNPTVVNKIIDEVKSVCGVGESAEYTYDTMAKLKYTHCVALEVLRLHPPVSHDSRLAVNADILPDGTKIPAGVGIEYCIYTMGRKEDIWGEDAMQFKPERFMSEQEPSTFKYPVFNAGPRMCIGKPLALMNMKLAMSILLTSNFKFEDKAGHTGEYSWALVESMKGGFEVNVTKS